VTPLAVALLNAAQQQWRPDAEQRIRETLDRALRRRPSGLLTEQPR
jgi:hypothetical protein